MAKITKKQSHLYLKLLVLYHELIRAKHENQRDRFDEIVVKIREEIEEAYK